MSDKHLMAFDHNPAVGRYGFAIDRNKISFHPAPKKDRTMPRIALDDALPAGQPISSGIAAKLMSYLETVLRADQLDDVAAILAGGEADTAPTPAMDRAMKRHADNVKRRQDSLADFDARFPNSNRLKR